MAFTKQTTAVGCVRPDGGGGGVAERGYQVLLPLGEPGRATFLAIGAVPTSSDPLHTG